MLEPDRDGGSRDGGGAGPLAHAVILDPAFTSFDAIFQITALLSPQTASTRFPSGLNRWYGIPTPAPADARSRPLTTSHTLIPRFIPTIHCPSGLKEAQWKNPVCPRRARLSPTATVLFGRLGIRASVGTEQTRKKKLNRRESL
jgi:hypothetical protein